MKKTNRDHPLGKPLCGCLECAAFRQGLKAERARWYEAVDHMDGSVLNKEMSPMELVGAVRGHAYAEGYNDCRKEKEGIRG